MDPREMRVALIGYPAMDWERTSTQCFNRVAQHGRRRSEEMREAAATVLDAGFAPPFMSAATAQRHRWVADLAEEGVFAGLAKESSWRDYADRIVARGSARRDLEGGDSPPQGAGHEAG